MSLAAYTAAVLGDSPVAYWKLDEASGLPQDSSGNGRHMTSKTIDGSHYEQTGPFSGWKSIVFAGGEKASRSQVSTAINNFTYEGWLRLEIVGDVNQALFSNQAGSSGWAILTRQSLQLRALLQGVAGEGEGSALTVNTWYHVVISRRAGSWLYFLNGAADGTSKGSDTPGGSPTSCTIHGGDSIQAHHSHVAYYDSALSDSAILAHYNAALAADVAAFTPRAILL